MKSFAIVVKDNNISESGYRELKDSYDKYGHEEGIEPHYATELDKVENIASANGLQWNYPWEGQQTDLKTGLIKTAYPTADKRRRMSCFMSHWYLWQKCVKLDETICVLEHDARFIKKLPSDRTFKNCKYDIIGINDPSMATRKSKVYHDKILEGTQFFQPVPTIDEFNIPQGLAGNSAYVIKPTGAKTMIELSKEHGMWPNDALMCKQLISTIGVTRNFYTRVQGLRSTTTL
tara:strand:+ start:2439 stop:3137 length:699 start_codon:yes stop_codon:yes gene_type:complete